LFSYHRVKNVDREKKKRVAIVGGGLAGIACGIALVNLGCQNVHIFERDENFAVRRQGYGLTILQGISALKNLGKDVFDTVQALDTPSRSHYMFDWRGRIIGFYGTCFWQESNTKVCTTTATKPKKKHNLHISRQNLRRILKNKFESCASSHLHWNKRLSRLIHKDKGCEEFRLEFSDGTTHTADLVIGCDGINSQVRRAMFGYEQLDDTSPLNYLGIIVVLGITYSDHSLCKERVFQTVDGNTRLFAMPYADSEDSSLNTMWQLSFPLPESRALLMAKDPALLKKEVMDMCGQWHEPIPSMIESTELALFMGIAAYDRDPVLPSKRQDALQRIVLLGDAAHPMSPFKGQGANQALLDAVGLASWLCQDKGCAVKGQVWSMEEAIACFEKEMFDRVKSKVIMSRERAATFHDPSIVQTESFAERGVSEDLIETLNSLDIDAQSGDEIEKRIIQVMQQSTTNSTGNNTLAKT
jgi:2-polyprenyl-6-methoxyphenol hydroxylase-like FAD-dependent oxidoreductase